jgi:hypothetical protein
MSKTFKDVKKYHNGRNREENRNKQRELKQLNQYKDLPIEREF